MQAKLLIATPVLGAELFSASISAGYSESVRQLAREMPIETLSASLFFSHDNTRARNRCVGLMLSEPSLAECTHVLFWDSDQWPEDRKIVQEMMYLNLPIVSAPYTNKKLPLRWIHQAWNREQVIDEHGCVDVKAVGMGFTMISRACLEQMSAKARVYTDWPHRTKLANVFGALYDRMTPSDDPADEGLLSEDFSFCKRWREEHGGKVLVYTKAGIIYHAGAHAWSAREMPGGVQ